MPGNGKVFVSHSHEDNERCQTLLAALAAWGVDYWFDRDQMHAGQDLSDRIQQALEDRDIFIRVCTAAVQQRPHWVNLETNAFRVAQADDENAGRVGKRTLISLVMDTVYTPQLFEKTTLYIDAARQPLPAWLAELKRAVLPDEATQVPQPAPVASPPPAVSAAPLPAPSAGAQTSTRTLVVDWRAGDHSSITDAVAAARPGDRILVRPGVYTEVLTITKPLEIVGDGEPGEVVVQTASMVVLTYQAPQGRIANLTIRQMGGGSVRSFFSGGWVAMDIAAGRLELEDCDISSQSGACVYVHGGADLRMRRNLVANGKMVGVFVAESGRALLEENELASNGDAGLNVQTGGVATARRNRIHDNGFWGVVIRETGQCVMEDNELFRNGYSGVHIQTALNTTVRNNRIHDNKQAGVAYNNGQGTLEENEIWGNALSGVEIKGTSSPTVMRNTIRESKQCGVLVWENGQGTLEENTIVNNGTHGVEIRAGGSPTLRRNTISRNANNGIWAHENGGGVFEANDLRDNAQGAWLIESGCEAKVTRTGNQE